MSTLIEPALTSRQEREIAYHKEFASNQANRHLTPVNFDVIEPGPRRWYNAFWATYDRIMAYNLKGKAVLVPGCGFGEDAIRLARLGAQVSGFDLSPDILEVTRKRVAKFAPGQVDLAEMPSEKMAYPDNSFDMVVLIDILHHVDIPATMAEIVRVLKPGGHIVGNELYTHSFAQRHIRHNTIVDRYLYPKMRSFIYGNDKPYITEDEHKIDEHEFDAVLQSVASIRLDYFNTIIGRLVPDRFVGISKLDRALTKGLGPAGKYSASRVVFDGQVPG
jgi:ubiquinone/menaquinone biosynthesis C-methylase UbiE